MCEVVYVRLGNSKRAAVSGGIGPNWFKRYRDFRAAEVDEVGPNAQEVFIKIGRRRAQENNFPIAIAVPNTDAVTLAAKMLRVAAKTSLGNSDQRALVERLIDLIVDVLVDESGKSSRTANSV